MTRVYGDLDADYNIADVTGLVNGDEDGTVTFNKDMITDGGLVDNQTKTNNANKENEHYTWSFDKEALGGVANLLNNYSVTINDGKSTVTKANLTVTADDQNMLVGTTPNFTGTTLGELELQLVNGDRLPSGFGYEFGLEDESVLNIVGAHPGVIGLFYDGTFYGGGTHDLSTLSSVFRNYDVTVDAGTLTVSAGDNFGHLHWLHRGGDRERNFRERKAEIYFHEGGMVHEETM